VYSFDDIYGNDVIKKHLRGAIAEKKSNHAYIITGSRGCGKSLLAKTAAKTLQCEKGGDNPCGQCVSCKTFDSGNNCDIFYATPQKNKKSIGVDDIRDMVCAPMAEKPFKFRYKIFIIENGDAMTPAAQNALLKVLEEPADYGIFLITAVNLERFLPTVLSRAVNISMKSLPDSTVASYLTEKAGFSEAEAENFAAYAGGSIGKAMALKNDKEFLALKNAAEETAAAKYSNMAEIFRHAKTLDVFSSRISEFLSILCLIYRDMIVYKTCGGRYLSWKQNTEIIKTAAERNSLTALLSKFEAVCVTADILSKNANFTMSMDVLLMSLNQEPSYI